MENKKVVNLIRRQVTFSERRKSLIEKAEELTTLHDVEVAVMVFSATGKLYEFSSQSMEKILSRYCNTKGLKLNEAAEGNQPQEAAELDTTAMQEEITKLREANLRMTGKELDGLELKELHDLENQLSEGILAVKNKKERLLIEQLEKSRLKEQKAKMEIVSLHKQIEEIENKRKSKSTADTSADTSLQSGLPSDSGSRRKSLRIRASNHKDFAK